MILSCDSGGGLLNQQVIITLPHHEEQYLYDASISDETRVRLHTTQCERKRVSSHTYYCLDSREYVTAYCNGSRMSIVTYCPQVQRASDCAVVDSFTSGLSRTQYSGGADSSYSGGAYNCSKVEGLSDGNVTTCSCTMCMASSSGTRRNRRLSVAQDGGAVDEDEIEVIAITYFSTTVSPEEFLPGSSLFYTDWDSSTALFMYAFVSLWVYFTTSHGCRAISHSDYSTR